MDVCLGAFRKGRRSPQNIHPQKFESYRSRIERTSSEDRLFFVTLHPRWVDIFDPGSVAVVTDQSAAALTDHPDWIYWKDEMTPGEFWTWAGESWANEVSTDKAWVQPLANHQGD
jgi:hypothetical protein